MAGNTAYPQILANLAAGNEPVSIIDSNFTPLYGLLNALNTFGNYYADSGAANAYVISLAANQTATLAAGLPVQFLAAHSNTGASTLDATGSAKNILNPDGTALVAGQIVANAIVSVMYDGTQYQLLSGGAPALGRVKIGSFTRDTSTASGTQAVTGVGFKPRSLLFIQCGTTAWSGWSIGWDNVTATGCIASNQQVTAGTAVNTTSFSVQNIQSNTNDVYQGKVQSLDADGFTMVWTKTNSPTGTTTILYFALG